MNSTPTATKEVVTLINVFTVEPENQSKLLELLRENTNKIVATLDGWISTSFIAATNQRKVVIYSQWRDSTAIERMRTNPSMMAYFPKISALATLESIAGDVVYSHRL
jgi:quinol monooxygenase YgiN